MRMCARLLGDLALKCPNGACREVNQQPQRFQGVRTESRFSGRQHRRQREFERAESERGGHTFGKLLLCRAIHIGGRERHVLPRGRPDIFPPSANTNTRQQQTREVFHAVYND